MARLGAAPVSALTDVTRVMMVHGVTATVRDGWAPLVTNLAAVKGTRQELMSMGTALDMWRSTTAMQGADVFDQFGRGNKVERATKWLADRFGTVTGMNWWNSQGKKIAGTVTMSNIMQAVLDEVAGKATAEQIRKLRASSISEASARQIARQFAKHGGTVDGLHVPNRLAWDPEARVASESYAAAVVRDVDRIIVTPGQEKPFWMSSWQGSFFGQFKSFNFASMEKTILAGLQQRDAGVFTGAMMMMAVGAGVEAIRNVLAMKEQPKTPTQWAVQAFERSGLAGILFEVNHFAEAATMGAIGVTRLTGRPVSRFASRNAVDAVIGPTAGLVADLFQASAGVFGSTLGHHHKVDGFKVERLTEEDIRAFRRSLIYQNVWYWGWLVQMADKGVAKAVGAKPAKDKPRWSK